MKNKYLVFSLLIIGLLSAGACHKCVECTETNATGGNEIEWPEVCGKKQEIEDYRSYMEQVVNPGNKVQCKERKTTLF